MPCLSYIKEENKRKHSTASYSAAENHHQLEFGGVIADTNHINAYTPTTS